LFKYPFFEILRICTFPATPAWSKPPSQIFLIVDLFEPAESPRTIPVDPKLGWFNTQLKMICKNDFILSTYFKKSAIPVQLCRVRDD
jgi:hypothetical protein